MKAIKKFAKSVKDIFSSNGQDIDTVTEDLYLAVKKGDVETVKLLLTQKDLLGADMAFDIAIANGCLEMVYLLKDYCPNHPLAEHLIEKGTNYFLCSAVKSGNVSFADYLITEKEANVYSIMDRSDNAFDIAIARPSLEMVFYLKDYFPNHPMAEHLIQKGDNYFLCSAVKIGNIFFADYLITEKGADIYSVFDKHLSACDIAAENGDTEMMGYLQPYFPNHQCYFEEM